MAGKAKRQAKKRARFNAERRKAKKSTSSGGSVGKNRWASYVGSSAPLPD